MKVYGYIIGISALALAVSFWMRNTLPPARVLLPIVAEEPAQTPTRKRAFDAVWKGLSYRVKPRFDYELTGLVVSFRLHDGNSRMHRRAQDHLNAADLCVVWDQSASTPFLNRMSFWNGIFTCNFKTTDQQAWESFNPDQLSNNHLISDDARVRDAIADVRIGDQIRMRGFLADYTSPGGGTRKSSVVRTDGGNGACETIYVEQFDILKRSTGNWRIAMYVSLALLLLSLALYLRAPHRVRR
ncbi:MAG: hypothetical protein AAFO81_09460 [Pseudomonadota bacterium]